jgi:hypothetical protein
MNHTFVYVLFINKIIDTELFNGLAYSERNMI